MRSPHSIEHLASAKKLIEAAIAHRPSNLPEIADRNHGYHTATYLMGSIRARLILIVMYTCSSDEISYAGFLFHEVLLAFYQARQYASYPPGRDKRQLQRIEEMLAIFKRAYTQFNLAKEEIA